MKPTNRNYRATFIVDNRGKEDSIEQIIEGVKTEIGAIQGDISAVENLGKHEFARVTDAKLVGSYSVPKIDVQVGGSFQSVPGIEYAATYAAPNATIQQSLGRLPTDADAVALLTTAKEALAALPLAPAIGCAAVEADHLQARSARGLFAASLVPY